jgi:hypothetical protein
MNLKYKIYPDRSLLVDVLTGDLTYGNVKYLVEQEKQDKDFHRINRVISDTRKANLKIKPEEVQEYLAFIKEIPMNVDFRWAILASTPDQTALTMLIGMDPFFKKLVAVFSTVRACVNFISVPYDEREFNDADFITVM